MFPISGFRRAAGEATLSKSSALGKDWCWQCNRVDADLAASRSSVGSCDVSLVVNDLVKWILPKLFHLGYDSRRARSTITESRQLYSTNPKVLLGYTKIINTRCICVFAVKIWRVGLAEGFISINENQ